MNPAKSLHSTPQRTNRLAQTAPPAPTQSSSSSIDGFKTNIVSNIPVKAPAADPAAAGKSNNDPVPATKQPTKPHHAWFRHYAKPPAAKTQSQPAPTAVPTPKPAADREFPLTAVLFTLLIAGALIAIAVYTYRS